MATEEIDPILKENEEVRQLKDSYKYGWHDATAYDEAPQKGLSHEVIDMITKRKNEPQWMSDFRHKALDYFYKRPMPSWGADLSGIDFENIYYYIKPMNQVQRWEDMPEAIKSTWDKLGIPEAEKNFLGGVSVQYESESVYHSTQKHLEDMGVIFTDMDSALREYPDLVKQYFGTIIPPNDNKFAALNSAVWSGGSFIWVPKGVSVEVPLQAYFRINQENMGQFERTLIICEDESWVHYVEGCSAPTYSSDSLHSAVVEIVVKDRARCRYTTIQNWSDNVYNLVTKRAVAYKEATMEWVDGNIGCLAQGSRVTTRSGMKPIELVTPGEDILSYDDSKGELCWRAVVAKKYSGEQPVREVRLGMRRLFVTDNHPFYSFVYDGEGAKKSGRYELAYVRADALTEAIVPRTSIEYGEPWKLEMPELVTEFQRAAYEETTDDLLWFFGVFTGNGHIETESKVVFSVPTDDRARTRLMTVMSELVPGTEPTERKDGVTVTWNSVELADFFEKNGFVTGAREKRIPNWVFSLPESQRLSFIAGYLDSDGCSPSTRRRFEIKSVNRWLLEDAGEILATLGITARIYTESWDEKRVQILGYESVSHGSHRLEFPIDERLLERVSEPLREAALRQPEAVLRTGRIVGRSNIELPESVEVRKVDVTEPLATVATWDIEVEGTGNFVSEGFIVHNSKVTMKYPAVILKGEGSKAEILSVAYASAGQHQDAGAKVTHVAPNTQSTIVSKSISKDGGRAGYRGLVRMDDGATHAKSNVRCDALILDADSRSDTYPYNEIEEETGSVGHEATVSKIGDEQLFYLRSRGIDEVEAMSLIVRGFIEPITKELPLEYSVELNRLIQLQMEGSVG